MEFHYEVTAKVETLGLDGNTRYTLQGKLSFHVPGEESAGEPLNLALVFPEDGWNGIDVGDILTFRSTDFYQFGENDHWSYLNQVKHAEKELSKKLMTGESA